jgi:hypothetical protein
MQGIFPSRVRLFGVARQLKGSLRVWRVIGSTALLLVSGCASLPDVNRIQNNMDAMTHYMGVMAGSMPLMVNSTSRMAETAERLERKSNALLDDLQKKGGTAERTIQNYSQALLDNERAKINNLKGIVGELRELSQSFSTSSRGPRSEAQDGVNSQILAKLNALETRINALEKMEQMNRQPAR